MSSLGRESFEADCRNLIRDITGARQMSLDAFIRAYSARSGREIVRLHSSLGGERACGFLLSDEHTDYLVHAPGITPMHDDHIAAHELGHVIGEHYAVDDAANVEALTARLLPDIHPTKIRRLLGRTHYADRHEREAELFASILMGELSRPSAMLQPGGEDSDRDPLQWLFDATPRRSRR